MGNSIVSNNSSDISDDDLSNSDHSDEAVKIRSLLNYEFTSGQYNNPSVRGRLSLCYDQRGEITSASGFILSVVRDGHKIPFVTLSPPKVIPKARRTLELSAELSVTRGCWRKLFPQVCGVMFCDFCHACHELRIFNMLNNFVHE